jgi:hypothetical protein
VTLGRVDERLVFNQALALMKKPQNQGLIPRFFNLMLDLPDILGCHAGAEGANSDGTRGREEILAL